MHTAPALLARRLVRSARDRRRSEVVIFLFSPTVLHAPYCLLELYEAHRRGVPVLLIATHPTWLAASAIAYLENLEDNLTRDNPAALAAVRKHLQMSDGRGGDAGDAESAGPTVEEFCEEVISALQLRELEAMRAAPTLITSRTDPSSAAPSRRPSAAAQSGQRRASRMNSIDMNVTEMALEQLTLSMYESDRQLDAVVTTLCERMCFVTGREPPQWDHEQDTMSLHERLLKGSKFQHPPALSQGRSTRSISVDGASSDKSADPSTPSTEDERVGCWAAVVRAYSDRQDGQFKAFITCDVDDDDAWAAAKVLQVSLQQLLGASVVMEERSMEADDGSPIPWGAMRTASVDARSRRAYKLLEEGVIEAETLVLLQTPGVYYRADCVLQMYEAARVFGRARIIPINLLGSGYDFVTAAAQLATLTTSLECGHHALAATELEVMSQVLHARHHKTLADVEDLLKDTVPALISLPLDMRKHRHQIDAAIYDIAERIAPGGVERRASRVHEIVKVKSSSQTAPEAMV